MAPSILPRTAIGKIFDSADSALIVFDGMSRLIYLSPWLCQRLGHPAAELLGRIGTFGGSHPVESPQFAVDRLAPPPAVFDGVSVTLTTDLKNTIGQAATEVPVVIDYHPLKGPSGELQGVLGIGSAWDEGSREGRSRFPSSDDLHRKLLVLRSQWQEAYSLEDVLVGESPEAVRLRRQVRLASTCRENILLTGPAGCGKERVARAIHFAGTESAGASLIPLDCALLDAELLQTTVTAFLRRCAALETATVPTLLLLDIDRLDEPGQGELLGMLAIHELEIRTIATARHEFVDSNAGDHFRSDLAAILSTLWISFPAVQDRPSDIPFMAQYCVEQCNIGATIARQGFTREALERLAVHSWPGDFEELSQVVAAAHQRAEGAWIQPKDLPKVLQGRNADLRARPPLRDLSVAKALAELESSILQEAMRIAKGNKSKAARLVGMSRPKLLRRLEHFGLIQADGQHEPQ